MCPACSLVYQYKASSSPAVRRRILKQQSVLSIQCSHLGLPAFFLALLLKERALFLLLLNLRFPAYAPISSALLPSSCRLWPAPFFESGESLREFFGAARSVPLVEAFDEQIDDEAFLAYLFGSWFSQSLPGVILEENRCVRWISKEKGFGLFSKRMISSGSRIGIYAGAVRRCTFFEKRPHEYVADLTGWRFGAGLFSRWVVDATESGSVLRYVNHDPIEPALGQRILCWRGLPLISFETIRQVEKGEELTINYGFNLKPGGRY